MRMSVAQFRAIKGDKPSKMGNVRTEYMGRVFASKKEARYCAQLDLMLRAKEIVSYEEQVGFPIIINGHKICVYYCDFYVTYPDGHVEVIDVKGRRTDMYRLKKKLVESIYPFKIKEVFKV